MITIERVDSRHLAHNLLGDPPERDLVVYVPPTAGDRPLPVLVLLHGYGQRARARLIGPSILAGHLMPPIDTVLDEVFADPAVPPMLVAMPDGWSGYGCGQWVDSAVNGLFERYVTEEVIGIVDSRYSTIPDRAARGVFGSSSGGLGAWQLATRHPDVFGAMAFLSGDCYFDFTHRIWLYRYFDALFPGEPSGPIPGDWNSLFAYGLSAAYTPNPARPPYYVDFPIEYPSGDIVPELWERWLSYDPVVNYAERASALRSLRGILLQVGSRDHTYFHYGHRILSKRLAAAGIEHVNLEDDGTHMDPLMDRIQVAVRWFGTVLQVAA